MADESITITIDGQEISAKPGQTIIQAAMAAGMYIPYLCYYPGLKPYGACRMCVVESEVNGRKATVASCTAGVANGQTVETNTQEIVELRRGITELLMTEHPHGCLTCHRIELCGPQDICQRHVAVTDRCTVCPKNERCELKDHVRHMELDMNTPLKYHRRNMPIHTDDPFYDRDYNLCIVCVRCVRVCDEMRGDEALSLISRGGNAIVGTSHGTSLLESGCEFCGACIDVCPTGALVERDYKWEKAESKTTTTCVNCPVGCEFTMEVNRRNKVIRMVGDLGGEAGHGQACFKGKFGYDYPNHKRRLKYPMVRVDGELQRTTWEQALQAAADGLNRYGPDERGVIASPRGTNEDAYVAQKFARSVLGTNNVDSGFNLVPELTQALEPLLGYPAGTGRIWGIEKSNCVMVVGGNPTEEQNVLTVPVKRAARRGASLIVIDPRETELTRYATHWLRPKAGAEIALLGGIIRVILDEALEDKEFTADQVSGLDELKRSAWTFDLMKVSEATGVSEDEIREAARAYAGNNPAALLYGAGSLDSEGRSDLASAAANLALVTGNVGRDGGGLFPLYSGANTQGAQDVGCAPDRLPGFRSAASEEDRRAVEGSAGYAVPATQGLGIRDMAKGAASGDLKALIVMADGFDSDAAGLTSNGFPKPEFLVVSDAFLSDLASQADVVLPAATYAEVDGTITNLERRVQPLRAGMELRNEERSGWQTLSALASAMGGSGFDYRSAEHVFSELTSVVPAYAGLTYERLADGGKQWPVSDSSHVGTAVLYEAANEGADLAVAPIRMEAPEETTDAEFPFVLAHGRVLHQPDEEVTVLREGKMNHVRRDEHIEIHPDDAAGLGISEGDPVQIMARENPAASPLPDIAYARLTSPRQGLVSVTTLFAEVATVMEENDSPDPAPAVRGLPLRKVALAKARVEAEITAAD